MSKLGDFLHDLPYDLELLRLKKFDKKIEELVTYPEKLLFLQK